MRIVSLHLKHFRCFKSLELDFNKPITLIIGPNGTGKTSILEAFHYLCYLKSFKAHGPKDLIQLQAEGFSITMNLATPHAFDVLYISCTDTKKSVLLNQKPVSSFKELYNVYKAISITEDDLTIIQGAPSIRRSFIDQIVTLNNPAYVSFLRKYRQILNNRNALLASNRYDQESYNIWSEQLFSLSLLIQQERQKLIDLIFIEASALLYDILGPQYTFSISYKPTNYSFTLFSNFKDFVAHHSNLPNQEYAQRRSLFGIHLDDYNIIFQEKSSRIYASRGQQKLIIFLLKLAQLQLIHKAGHEAVFLIDDFMTDFDESKIKALLPLITRLANQVIITSPIDNGPLVNQLFALESHIISL